MNDITVNDFKTIDCVCPLCHKESERVLTVGMWGLLPVDIFSNSEQNLLKIVCPFCQKDEK